MEMRTHLKLGLLVSVIIILLGVWAYFSYSDHIGVYLIFLGLIGIAFGVYALSRLVKNRLVESVIAALIFSLGGRIVIIYFWKIEVDFLYIIYSLISFFGFLIFYYYFVRGDWHQRMERWSWSSYKVLAIIGIIIFASGILFTIFSLLGGLGFEWPLIFSAIGFIIILIGILGERRAAKKSPPPPPRPQA